MKYKVGDKVRIVKNPKFFCPMEMKGWLGSIVTISYTYPAIHPIGKNAYSIKEDDGLTVWGEHWFEEKVGEELPESDYYLFKYLSAKLSEKEAELTEKLGEIKKIQKEIKEVLDSES